MKLITKNQTTLFFLFAISFILSILIKPYPLSWLAKLVPMVFLIVIAVTSLNGRSAQVFIAGLVFSAFGDFFLDYDRVNWFIFGLGSFFIAHVCYLVALYPVEKKHLKFVGLYIIYGIAMFSLISGGLAELFIPVFAYMSILLLMAIVTLLSTKSNNWLIVGGLSFVFSDSLIGIDKFYQTIPYASIMIMMSYYFAQYALLKGYLKSQQ